MGRRRFATIVAAVAWASPVVGGLGAIFDHGAVSMCTEGACRCCQMAPSKPASSGGCHDPEKAASSCQMRGRCGHEHALRVVPVLPEYLLPDSTDFERPLRSRSAVRCLSGRLDDGHSRLDPRPPRSL